MVTHGFLFTKALIWYQGRMNARPDQLASLTSDWCDSGVPWEYLYIGTYREYLDQDRKDHHEPRPKGTYNSLYEVSWGTEDWRRMCKALESAFNFLYEKIYFEGSFMLESYWSHIVQTIVNWFQQTKPQMETCPFSFLFWEVIKTKTHKYWHFLKKKLRRNFFFYQLIFSILTVDVSNERI